MEERALSLFSKAGDTAGAVRLLLRRGLLDEAKKLAKNRGDRRASLQVAEALRARGEEEEAVDFLVQAGFCGEALTLL